MEYLVIMKLQEAGYGTTEEEKAAILSDVMIPSLDMLIGMEGQGMLTGGFFEGQRSAALVVTAEDEEKLDDALSQLPCSQIFEMEILPLQSLKEAKERDQKILEGLKAAMG